MIVALCALNLHAQKDAAHFGGHFLRLPLLGHDQAARAVLRGITQSAQDPAIQGSIDWASESGLYLGAWASNIDFGNEFDADVEVDLYAGFSGGDEVAWDIGFIYYGYPGAGSHAGEAGGTCHP